MTLNVVQRNWTSGVLIALWLAGCSPNNGGASQNGSGGSTVKGSGAIAGALVQSGGTQGSANLASSGGSPVAGSSTERPLVGGAASGGDVAQSSGGASSSVGLGGTSTVSTTGGRNEAGGAQASTHSTASTGGVLATMGGVANGGSDAASGGAPATGGVPATGGTTTASGGVPTGGSTVNGGAPQTGGTTATGGAPTGGTSSTGGTTSAGGAPETGGVPSADGCVIPPGNALSFDNASQPQYVLVKNNAALHLTSAFTIEAWVRVLAANTVIIAKAYGTVNEDSFALWFQPGALYFAVMQPTTVIAWSLGVGNWHHVAATYEAGAQVTQQIYVDGILTQVTNVPVSPTYDWHPLLIGAAMESGAFAGGFKGDLDEIRIYSTVRTANQIAADMKGLCSTTTDPDLVAYFPFNEGSGNTTYDVSSNHFEGTLGSPTTGTAAMPTWTKSGVPF